MNNELSMNNYLLENINCEIAKLANGSDDPAVLRRLKQLKKWVTQLNQDSVAGVSTREKVAARPVVQPRVNSPCSITRPSFSIGSNIEKIIPDSLHNFYLVPQSSVEVRNAALEEAASACEAVRKKFFEREPTHTAQQSRDAIATCTQAIRALKSTSARKSYATNPNRTGLGV